MTTNTHIEEKLNAFTHSLGTGLSIAALLLLVSKALNASAPASTQLLLSTALIYGTTQILLYLSSALTHEFYDLPQAHYYLRIFDQVSVYLLIAGTYTPVTLISLAGSGGLVLFGLEWALAVLGILLKLFIFREKHIISDLLYIPMGWMILFVLPALLELPTGLIISIFTGGIIYTAGVTFYLSRRIPYSHVLWHLCVIAGSVSFFIGYVRYVY
jgi:hemolysin III